MRHLRNPGFMIAVIVAAGSTGCAIQQMRTEIVVPPPSRKEMITDFQSLELQAMAYKCDVMVRIVNGLRAWGKQDALRFLHEYYAGSLGASTPQDVRMVNVICICRLLFRAPVGGWKVPWLGVNESHGAYIIAIEPKFNSIAERALPVFPMVVIDGVPFLLTDTFGEAASGGTIGTPLPDEGESSLSQAQSLELITQDMPINGYNEAALKLLQQRRFNDLFANTNADKVFTQIEILMQTQPSRGKEARTHQ